jgi:hypothetical protein
VTGLAVAFGGAGLLAAPAAQAKPCWDAPVPPPGCVEPTEPPDPPSPPAMPTGLGAPSVLQTAVTLRWTDVAADETAYKVTRQARATGASTVFTLPAGSTGWTDTGAAPNTAYRYLVGAWNANGDSGSPSVDVTTKPKPADVAGTASGGRVTGGAGQYRWDYVWIGGWAIDFDTTGPVDVRIDRDGVPYATSSASAAYSGLNAQHPGYSDAHGFSVSWIPVLDGKGTHTVCATGVSVGGGADRQLGCVSYVQPGPPSAASDLAATARPYSTEVAFTDRADDETGWYLQRSADAGASWVQVGSGPATAGTGRRTTAVDYSTFAAGSGVCYRVLTVNDYGQTPSGQTCL